MMEKGKMKIINKHQKCPKGEERTRESVAILILRSLAFFLQAKRSTLSLDCDTIFT